MMMPTPFQSRLATARNVLLAGCGGGFDLVSAIPIHEALLRAGKRSLLGNLSFSRLDLSDAERIGPAGRLIRPGTLAQSYFPERQVAQWLRSRGHEPTVVGFELTGALPLAETYDAVIEAYDIDTVVLVDGGTDSLIKGDEADLGTIDEDALSIVALSLARPTSRILACLGFGVDAFHGICHHSFLENAAETIRRDGFLGCHSVCRGTPEGDAFLDAVAFLNAAQPNFRSIVANSIASAMEGRFGDHHATERTRGSDLFINPLMSMYWAFALDVVAEMAAYRHDLARTQTFSEVKAVMRSQEARKPRRDWIALPL